MAWSDLTFAFGSKLTATKMTQLDDNFDALIQQQSGAPYVLGAWEYLGETVAAGGESTLTLSGVLDNTLYAQYLIEGWNIDAQFSATSVTLDFGVSGASFTGTTVIGNNVNATDIGHFIAHVIAPPASSGDGLVIGISAGAWWTTAAAIATTTGPTAFVADHNGAYYTDIRIDLSSGTFDSGGVRAWGLPIAGGTRA